MPGLFHFYSILKDNLIDYKDPQDCLKSHEDIKFHNVNICANNQLFLFGNNNYPLQSWQYNEYDVLIIGFVYNLKNEELVKEVNMMVDSIRGGSNYYSLINRFVVKCDGDFVIYLFSEKYKKGVLFNDLLGRLPVFYYSDGKQIVICSEQKGIINNLPSVQLNTSSIISYLMASQTYGEFTIFENVFRLSAGKVLEYDSNLTILIHNNTALSFELKDGIRTRKEAIKQVADLILESVQNRLVTLESNNYDIISDLSGGFDSRVVFGALAKFTKNIKYFTYEYIQDESLISKSLFDHLDAPGEFKKLSFKNLLNHDALENLVYKTDAHTNYYTTAVCFNDLDYLYNYVDKKKTARIGGLGGEFFRHPYKIHHRTIIDGVLNGIYNDKYSSINFLVKHDEMTFLNKIRKYLESYDQGKWSDNLKNFYFSEYYRIVVGINAEDRERIHFWTVHPLWTSKLVQMFANRLPLKWLNYDFFTEIMKQVDERLLEIPIFKKNIILKSSANRKRYDLMKKMEEIRYKYTLVLYVEVKNNFPRLMNIVKKNKKNEVGDVKVDGGGHSISALSLIQQLNFNKNIFDVDGIKDYRRRNGTDNINLVTLLIYLVYLEKEYPEKFKKNDRN